jgi:hypothetical protein
MWGVHFIGMSVKPQKFLLVLDACDAATFTLLNRLREQLNIACKGQYELDVAFNDTDGALSIQYGVRGAPALVNLTNGRIAYGQFRDKGFLLDLALDESVLG